MDLSIIIVTYNSFEPVRAALHSLEIHRPDCDHETIVVDNCSSDGTAGMIAGEFPWVRLVVNDENKGYSRGVNQGIAMSAGEMILILNPDVEVQEGSIDRLMTFMRETPDAGIAASKLLYPDGGLQYSCRTFPSLSVFLLRRTPLGRLFPKAPPLRRYLMMDYDHESAREVDWVIGACMLVRRDALERVGLMDERFFLYFEDIDWCFRMKHRGYRNFYVPESVMHHRYARSSAGSLLRKPFVLHLLSLLRYYEKWNKVFYFLRRYRNTLKPTVFVLADLCAVNAAFFAAYFIRDAAQPFFVNRLYPLDWYYYFIAFYNLIFFLTFLFSGLYRIRRETRWMEETLRVTRAVLLVFAILLTSTYLTRIRIYSRVVLLAQAFFSIIAVVGFRQIVRSIHRVLVRARFDLKRVLLVGDGREYREVSDRFAGHPELGLDVVGYVGTGDGKLGSVEELPEIAETYNVQEVVVLPSVQGGDALLPLMLELRSRMIQVRFVSPLARFLDRYTRIEELAGVPVFATDRGSLYLARRWFKRMFDFLLALLLLPLSAIMSVFYMIYASMTGGADASYETRYGGGGRVIRWPRIVRRDGREASDLFKAGLFVHVLLGRLSFIGPPAPPAESGAEWFEGKTDITPGVTGRWRIAGFRDRETAVREEMLDVHSWSVTRELLILLESLGAICTGSYPEWFYTRGSGS